MFDLFKKMFAKHSKGIQQRKKEVRELFRKDKEADNVTNYVHINHKGFYKAYKDAFGSIKEQESVDAINMKLHYIESLDLNYMSLEQWAYLFATIYHETAHTMQPITEYGGNSYFNKRYGPNTKVGKVLGNIYPGDGAKYCGRGDIQITGRRNYVLMTGRLGVNLVDDPELALDPLISIKAAVIGSKEGLYTGKGLSKYINKRDVDYLNARRVINGKDKAALIKKYALKFEQIFIKCSNMIKSSKLGE